MLVYSVMLTAHLDRSDAVTHRPSVGEYAYYTIRPGASIV